MYDFVLLTSLLLLIGMIVFWIRHPAASLLHPATIYLAFHGFIFVIRPIFARYYDFQAVYRAIGFQPAMADKITVLLAANLGFVAFMAAAIALAGRPIPYPSAVGLDAERRALRLPFMIVFILLGSIGLASILNNWQVQADDASTMLTNAKLGVTYNTTANGWFLSAQMVLAPLTVMFAWLYRFRLWALLPFAAYAVLVAGTGGRGSLIYAGLALSMLYLFDKRRKWPEWRAVLLFALLIAAFNNIVLDRGKAVREVFVEDSTELRVNVKDHLAPLEFIDFANMEFFEFIVHVVPQRSGTYDYFLSNLQILTEPIPRIWWSEKPLGAPVKLFNFYDYGGYIGMTNSVPGMGWIELGYFGVVIQSIIFALVYAGSYRAIMQRAPTGMGLMAYALFVAATVVTFRDGGLLTIVRQVPFYLGPVFLLWLLSRAFYGPGWNRAGVLPVVPASAPGVFPAASRADIPPAERRKALASAWHG